MSGPTTLTSFSIAGVSNLTGYVKEYGLPAEFSQAVTIYEEALPHYISRPASPHETLSPQDRDEVERYCALSDQAIEDARRLQNTREIKHHIAEARAAKQRVMSAIHARFGVLVYEYDQAWMFMHAFNACQQAVERLEAVEKTLVARCLATGEAIKAEVSRLSAASSAFSLFRSQEQSAELTRLSAEKAQLLKDCETHLALVKKIEVFYTALMTYYGTSGLRDFSLGLGGAIAELDFTQFPSFSEVMQLPEWDKAVRAIRKMREEHEISFLGRKKFRYQFSSVPMSVLFSNATALKTQRHNFTTARKGIQIRQSGSPIYQRLSGFLRWSDSLSWMGTQSRWYHKVASAAAWLGYGVCCVIPIIPVWCAVSSRRVSGLWQCLTSYQETLTHCHQSLVARLSAKNKPLPEEVYGKVTESLDEKIKDMAAEQFAYMEEMLNRIETAQMAAPEITAEGDILYCSESSWLFRQALEREGLLEWKGSNTTEARLRCDLSVSAVHELIHEVTAYIEEELKLEQTELNRSRLIKMKERLQASLFLRIPACFSGISPEWFESTEGKLLREETNIFYLLYQLQNVFSTTVVPFEEFFVLKNLSDEGAPTWLVSIEQRIACLVEESARLQRQEMSEGVMTLLRAQIEVIFERRKEKFLALRDKIQTELIRSQEEVIELVAQATGTEGEESAQQAYENYLVSVHKAKLFLEKERLVLPDASSLSLDKRLARAFLHRDISPDTLERFLTEIGHDSCHDLPMAMRLHSLIKEKQFPKTREEYEQLLAFLATHFEISTEDAAQELASYCQETLFFELDLLDIDLCRFISYVCPEQFMSWKRDQLSQFQKACQYVSAALTTMVTQQSQITVFVDATTLVEEPVSRTGFMRQLQRCTGFFDCDALIGEESESARHKLFFDWKNTFFSNLPSLSGDVTVFHDYVILLMSNGIAEETTFWIQYFENRMQYLLTRRPIKFLAEDYALIHAFHQAEALNAEYLCSVGKLMQGLRLSEQVELSFLVFEKEDCFAGIQYALNEAILGKPNQLESRAVFYLIKQIVFSDDRESLPAELVEKLLFIDGALTAMFSQLRSACEEKIQESFVSGSLTLSRECVEFIHECDPEHSAALLLQHERVSGYCQALRTAFSSGVCWRTFEDCVESIGSEYACELIPKLYQGCLRSRDSIIPDSTLSFLKETVRDGQCLCALATYYSGEHFLGFSRLSREMRSYFTAQFYLESFTHIFQGHYTELRHEEGGSLFSEHSDFTFSNWIDYFITSIRDIPREHVEAETLYAAIMGSIVKVLEKELDHLVNLSAQAIGDQSYEAAWQKWQYFYDKTKSLLTHEADERLAIAFNKAQKRFCELLMKSIAGDDPHMRGPTAHHIRLFDRDFSIFHRVSKILAHSPFSALDKSGVYRELDVMVFRYIHSYTDSRYRAYYDDQCLLRQILEKQSPAWIYGYLEQRGAVSVFNQRKSLSRFFSRQGSSSPMISDPDVMFIYQFLAPLSRLWSLISGYLHTTEESAYFRAIQEKLPIWQSLYDSLFLSSEVLTPEKVVSALTQLEDESFAELKRCDRYATPYVQDVSHVLNRIVSELAKYKESCVVGRAVSPAVS